LIGGNVAEGEVATSERRCFFVTRVGEKDSPERRRTDEVSEFIVRPILAEFDLALHRVDLDSTPGQVTAQIIRGLIESDVVLADLTGRNPNVFYELAVAHAFRRPVVMLIDSTDALPFDTQNERVISIGDDGQKLGAAEAEEARKQLRAALKIVTKEGYSPENLVTSAAGAQSLDALAPGDPVAAELSAVREQIADLHRITVRSSRAVTRTPRPTADFRAMRRLIEHLALEGGFVTEYELRTLLIDEDTTGSFDNWVREMAATMRIRRARWNIYDSVEDEDFGDGSGTTYMPDRFEMAEEEEEEDEKWEEVAE
jgi:hypothetical protein